MGTYLALFGCLIFAATEGVFGSMWINQNDGKVLEKQIIVAVCCLGWGVMGALICPRVVEKFQRFIGWSMGALIGVGLLFGFLFAVKGKVDEMLGDSHEYEGWWMFFLFTLCLPCALCMGYLFRDCLKYAIMAATAFGGAFIAQSSFEALLVCSAVDLQAVSEPIVQEVIMGIVAVI